MSKGAQPKSRAVPATSSCMPTMASSFRCVFEDDFVVDDFVVIPSGVADHGEERMVCLQES